MSNSSPPKCVAGSPNKSSPANSALLAAQAYASSSTKGVLHTQYGIFHAGPQLPKFVVKRVSSDYLVKVPGVGILRLNSAESASTYLNR